VALIIDTSTIVLFLLFDIIDASIYIAIIYTEGGIRLSALDTLGEVLARAGQWERAEAIADVMIEGV
jgi:hypothetical protein